MAVRFDKIMKGREYSRKELAAIWGYASYHAIARGVVTPQNDNKIVLFVTEQKQDFQEQYADRLKGAILEWEGPTDHFAERRMLDARTSGDQIHVFYRVRHHMDFTYLGQGLVVSHERYTDRPSKFRLEVGGA